MSIAIQAVVSLDTKMFTAGIRGLEARINQFAGIAVMQFGGVAQQIAAMWGAFGPAGAAITALAEVTRAGADMEQQMARVASYTGMASDEIRALQDDSMKLAGEYGFAAHEIGNALANLALAGLDTKEALTDVLRPSLMLAKATLGDTQQAAEAITSTLKVFQLEMGQATHVADMFAGAIASSPLDMQRLTDAMKYAGPTASAFGIAMEKTVEEVAALHQVGLRGQMAGTIFRGAILEMAKAARTGAGEVGRALQGWDVATEGLTGAVRRLNAAGVDASIVIEEVGKRAGPGVAALMKLGADAMDDLATKVERTASVEAMHEKQVGTLHGQYEILQGKIAEVSQKIYDKLLPGLMECVKMMQEAVDFAKKLGSAFGGIGDGISAVMPLLLRLTTTILGVNAAIKGLNAVGLATGGSSLGGIISGGRANLAARAQEMANARSAHSIAAGKLGSLQAQQAHLANVIAARQAAAQNLSGSDWVKVYNTMHPGNHLSALEAASRAQNAYIKQTDKFIVQADKLVPKIEAQNKALSATHAAYVNAANGAGFLGSGMSTLGGILTTVSTGIIAYNLGSWFFNQTEIGKTIVENAARALFPAYREVQEMEAALAMQQKELEESAARTQQLMEYGAGRGVSSEWIKLMEGYNPLDFKTSNGLMEAAGLHSGYRKIEQLAAEYKAAMDDLAQSQSETMARVSASIQRAMPDVAGFADEITQLHIAGELSDETFKSLIGQTASWAKETEKASKPVMEAKDALKGLLEQQTQIVSQRQAVEEFISSLEQEKSYSEDKGNWARAFDIESELEGAKAKLKELQEEEGKLASAVTDAEGKVNAAIEGEISIRDRITETIKQAHEVELERALQAKIAADNITRSYTDLAKVLKNNLDVSIEDSKKAFSAFGENATEAIATIRERGLDLSETLDYIQRGGEDLRNVFNSFSDGTMVFEEFVAKYGKFSEEVLRTASAMGISHEEAFAKVKAATDETAVATEQLSADTVELADRFSAMSAAEIENYVKGLKTLAKELDTVPPVDKDKFDWVNDLKGFKLPKIDYISQGRFFGDELKALANTIVGIDVPKDKLEWIGILKDFKLPRIDYISQGKYFANELVDMAKKFANMPDVSKDKLDWIGRLGALAKIPKVGQLKDIGAAIAGLADTINNIYVDPKQLDFLGALSSIAGLENASLLIGWKDNETLSSIDESLKTLAEMKGIIWT